MTLRTRQPTPENAPATLTEDQRRRVADALESAQSENTRRNYASQFGKFRAWCEREGYPPLPAQQEVLAAYAVELADDGKSMSTIRLAVAAIVDAHRSAGLESPQTAGVTETLRGLSRQIGVSQKQARPLMPLPRSGRRRSIPEGRGAVRSSRKKRLSSAAGWTSPWHP